VGVINGEDQAGGAGGCELFPIPSWYREAPLGIQIKY
jgi:hypothetical protein